MRILFIGNFLSRSRGSYAVSEFISSCLAKEQGVKVSKASTAENRIVRLLEILWAVLFRSYTMVHIDVFSGNSFLFARIAANVGKLRKKRVVLTLHGGALHEYYIGRETAFQRLFRHAYVQSPSHFLKDFFEHQHLTVKYCPNPVYLANFPFERTHVRPNSLLWVRAFTEIYNPRMPVLVLKDVLQDFPNSTLTMIGPDKGLMKEISKLIRDLEIDDKVNIVGPVSNEKLSIFYQTHSVYLNTPSYESFGMSVVEAACCGIPTISFCVGEIPYIWTNDKNILMSEVNNVDQMANQVRRIFHDIDFERKLSLNGRERVEEFSWTVVRERWIELIMQDNS